MHCRGSSCKDSAAISLSAMLITSPNAGYHRLVLMVDGSQIQLAGMQEDVGQCYLSKISCICLCMQRSQIPELEAWRFECEPRLCSLVISHGAHASMRGIMYDLEQR